MATDRWTPHAPVEIEIEDEFAVAEPASRMISSTTRT
jgi:hypothetical protein